MSGILKGKWSNNKKEVKENGINVIILITLRNITNLCFQNSNQNKYEKTKSSFVNFAKFRVNIYSKIVIHL